MPRQRLQASHVEMGGQDERWEMSFEIDLSRNQKPETETNSLDQKTRDAGNLADDPFEMATRDVSRAHFTVKLAT